MLVRSTGTHTTVMFLRPPQVKIRKRLRAGAIAQREAKQLPGRTKRAFRL